MPNLLTRKKFDFVSQSPDLAPDAFTVVEFSGFEGFSTCYQFEITLVGTDPEIDITSVLEHPATFTILRDDGDIPFHGILTEFDQLHAIDEYVVYKTMLAPKLWWLSLTHHNQVFLDKTAPEVLAAVLTDGGLTTNDFELRLMNEEAYEPWEFICQYGESHLNFVSRWMEREGMYFYFEQTPSGEKVIITDTSLSHEGMAEGKTMYYSPPSGLDEPFREEVIHAFVCKQKLLPGKVHVRDYNYRTPSLNLSAEAEVSARGRGEFHIYGDHFRTLQEGSRLADIRSQELRSHEKRFHGESTIPYLRPGYLFDLERHYRGSFNQQYLTIELSHAGSQTGFLISGIGRALSESEKRPYYRNSFVTIPAEIQFRNPQKIQKPRFYGTIHATVDAEGSGEYAELDEHGRYKVRLPFDLSGREGGKASHWLRMAQPYAGTDHGMHFPLHKGTEVLLTFIEGDPDRPIIAAAVPNPEKPSVIQDVNQTKAAITTSGQNKIHFEDQKGKQRILMHSPTANSWVRIGSHNDPDISDEIDNEIEELKDEIKQELKGELEDQIESEVAEEIGAFWEEMEKGIRIYSAENLWMEAQKRFADYKIGMPGNRNEVPKGVQYLWDKFQANGAFQPKGMLKYKYDKESDPLSTWNGTSFPDLVKYGHVRMIKGDTFNTQEGNIYDFGGYWNYNLGNSYAEDHIDQKAVLNQKSQVLFPSKPPGSNNMGLKMMLQGMLTAGVTALTVGLALGAGGPGSVLIGVIIGIFGAMITIISEAWTPGEPEQKKIGDAIAGPGSGKIKTWAEKVKSSDPDADGDFMHTDTTWVEKKFGDSYSYTKGNSIEISHGDKEEHSTGNTYEYVYGGHHEETKFNGKGIKTSHSWSGGGKSGEWSYSPLDGQVVKYEYHAKKSVLFDYELVLPTMPKFSIATKFSGLETSLTVSAGTKIDLEASLSVGMSGKFAAGFFVEWEQTPSFKAEINWDQKKIVLKGPGTEFEKKAAIDAELQSLMLEQTKATLGSKTLELKDGKLMVGKNVIKLEDGFSIKT